MTAAERTRPHSQREVEHKFRVHGRFDLPDLHAVEGAAAVENPGDVELDTAYFDTADLRLAREGMTLRRRTGGDEGWQLKVPAATNVPGTRDEIRLPLSAATQQPPEALLQVVRVIVRTAPVQLVARLQTERHTLLVRDDAGRPVADLVDDTVRVTQPDGTVTARFRELEVEEREGGPVLDRLLAALASSGAVSGEFVAKVVRALGPAATAEPEVPRPAQPGMDDPAGEAAVAYLTRQVRALRRADVAFRSSPETAGEAVHQLRVAARRLRGALRTFRPLLDHGWARQVRDDLAWFARGLTDLRESEVLRARLDGRFTELSADVAEQPARELVLAELDARVATARAGAFEVLEAERYLALHEGLVQSLRQPPLTAEAEVRAGDVLPGLVQDAWTRLAVAADGLTVQSPAEHWHDTRLRAKRTRYAAEAVAPVVGDDAKAFARLMERVTDLLGEHQDAVQAADVLRQLAAARTEDPGVASTLDQLAAAEDAAADAARQQFASVWAQARADQWRRWLTTP